jgi:glycosyltransferase involved in cell wall biosynthesis
MSNRGRRRRAIGVIGFFGNISEAKGVFDFLRVASKLESEGWNITARLAGPFVDRETESRVRQYMRSLRSIEYVGPTYGKEKDKFFEGIDVLLFPTRYQNEAEPVTIHEAMAHGVPVIAYGRGAIEEVVDEDCGFIVSVGEDFVSAAVERLRIWKNSVGDFQGVSQGARARFERVHQQGRRQWDALYVVQHNQDRLATARNSPGRDAQRNK